MASRERVSKTTTTQSGGGFVLTGEEHPPHSGELKHALSQVGGPTQSQLSRPVVKTPHLHGAPTKEETVKL